MPDELKGNIKEGMGKLTGNERMEAEGKAEKDLAKTKRKIEGAGDRLGGTMKEGLGKMAGDRSTELEGKIQKEKGRIKGS